MSSGQEPAPAKCRPWGRRFAAFVLLAIRHSSSWILRLAFLLLFLAIVLFAYLHLVGFPAYFTDLFLDRMARQGYFLQIERLTLEIDRGLVARNPRLFIAADAPKPFLQAEELAVAANPLPWIRHRQVEPVLSIVNGSLRADLGRGRFGTRQGSREIAVERIHLRFSATGREVVLREFSADFLDIHFRGRGMVYPSAKARTPAGNPLAAAIAAIENAPDWALQIVEQANQISFNEPPTADFSFSIRPDRPQAHSVAFRLNNSSGGQIRGVSFDRFLVDVAWKDRRLLLPDLQIHKGRGLLGLSGWYALSNQMVQAHLLNTLPPDTFLDLLPPRLQASASTVVTNYRFPLRLELQVGPAPWTEAAEHVSGRLSFAQAKVHDVRIDRLEAQFSRDKNEVRIEKATLQMPSPAEADPSRLEIAPATYDLASHRFEARVQGTLDPHALKPAMTPNMRNVVEWFGIREPVAANLMVGGVAGNPAIYCYGPVQAKNLAIQGVAVSSLQGRLDITNEVMHVAGATLVRPEGAARGDVHMAFSNQTLRLEGVESTLDPRAVAQMIGPAVAQFMEPFHLNVPTRLEVDGLLDYCNFSLNQLHARVDAHRFGFDRWEADRAEFELFVLGRRLRFTNAVATAYGGRFAGHGALYPVAGDSNWRYEVDFAATNVDMTNLLFAATGVPSEKLSGTLDGAAAIGGYVGKGTGTNVSGRGYANVRNGKLFETRLFQYLSDLLKKILPDFTMLAQTEAVGRFTIANGRLTSRDIQLQGTVFSVKASGDYAFGGALDYRVEVQLLRGGPIAAIVRLATLPVTRLLEFRLTGTFDDPRWSPVNLNPAELFSGESPPP
ncbi:MAG: AsmA-like C-terminal region-containing protein [Kiritimatiellia bacterium]